MKDNVVVYFYLIAARATLAKFPTEQLTGPKGNKILISIKYLCTLSAKSELKIIEKVNFQGCPL